MSLLPNLPDLSLPERLRAGGAGRAALTPIIAGLGMLGLGLFLRSTAPDALRLPEPGSKRKRLRDVRTGRDAAHVARDGIAGFIPGNLTGSLGRTLILMGAATIAVRVLDELVDDDSADY